MLLLKSTEVLKLIPEFSMSKVPALLAASILVLGAAPVFASDADAPPAAAQNGVPPVEVSKAVYPTAPGSAAAVNVGPGVEPATEKMKMMSSQFLNLQNATQMESRQFQTLSNPSSVRHDINLNPIRNIK